MSFSNPPPGGFEAVDAERAPDKGEKGEPFALELEFDPAELEAAVVAAALAIHSRQRRTRASMQRAGFEHMTLLAAAHYSMIRDVYKDRADEHWNELRENAKTLAAHIPETKIYDPS